MPTLSRDGVPTAAGVILRAPGGEMLFLQRSAGSDHAGTWCWPGGGTEDGEDAEATARREAQEETGWAEDAALTPVDHQTGAVDFSTFLADVPETFDPTLNDEHVDHIWATLEDAPEPLHPGVESTLATPLPPMAGADCSLGQDAAPDRGERLAFDRGSVRSYDRVGRLHVEASNISKANVCPYLGREIPDWEALGLDPDRSYMLLRDPDELAKAAPTFNNLPLLSRHVPVSAEDHQPGLVIGSTGTNAKFEAPYLRNSLVCWAGGAIKDIQSEVKKELSSAYHYRADMTPGTYDGAPYDGVMRDIVGNHVALVKEGRAGTDVVVGDSKEQMDMPKTVLTRKAAMAQGALIAYLQPRLAQDAQIDLGPTLKGVGPKNFKARKAGIAEAVRAATKGKLAQDADLDDLTGLLDALEGVDLTEGQDDDPEAGAAPIKKPDAIDADPLEQVKAFLKGKLSDEDMAQLDALMGAGAADEDDDKKDPEPPKDMVTKGAMDHAIAAAVRQASDRAATTQREIRDAERTVRPYVGDLAMAHDSADGVYLTALKAMGVDVAGVHASAYPAILKLQPLPSATAKKSVVAMDAAGAKSFADRFPEAARINTL
ncbi:MAG: uncharacterized protein JWQ97_3730 [Phenylobacterium sp.]|nr:uncharacterized protein [Phenylobacterium sp.]